MTVETHSYKPFCYHHKLSLTSSVGEADSAAKIKLVFTVETGKGGRIFLECTIKRRKIMNLLYCIKLRLFFILLIHTQQ